MTSMYLPAGSKPLHLPVGVFKSLQIRRVCRGVLSLKLSWLILPYPLRRYRCSKLMHMFPRNDFPVRYIGRGLPKLLARNDRENVHYLCTSVAPQRIR